MKKMYLIVFLQFVFSLDIYKEIKIYNYEVDDFYDMNDTEFSHFIKKTYNDFRKLFDSRDKNLWRKIKRDVNFLLWNNMKK